DRIEVQFAGRGLDRALDQIDRLRSAGAAIGRRRAGVRQYRIDAEIGGRNVIDADHRADHAEGGEQLAIRRDIGADIRDHVQPQPQNFRALVKGELDLADIVSPVLVGEDDLGALAAPFNGTAELLCRPQGQAVLDILPAFGAEAAADVVADHPDFALRYLEHHVGQHVADAVRVVDVGVKG